ncbi:MAG TPA: glutamine-hydrolyzing GMP synthase, partial [Acidiferrobacteraceae bacterium]|nr:glutamine-hydrolyzing GMP synthase [Acidiferrobacteraceae bacterium]
MTKRPVVPAAADDPQADRILILDFGSQYTQLIGRRVREAGVYCEIFSWDTDAATLEAFGPQGVILSGGPESVTAEYAPTIPPAVLAWGIPVLGICYGMQSMAAQLGGAVETAGHREYGPAEVRVMAPSALFGPSPAATLDVWMSHGDRVARLPAGFCVIAATANAPLAAIADEQRRYYGLQFHPEVTHTQAGQAILDRFVHEICGCRRLWTSGHIAESLIHRVRAEVAADQVILGLSGGVDSSVVAALLQRAIGEQLVCIFVDNGLLRLGEAEEVQKAFAQQMGTRLIVADARDRFLGALQGVDDPEQKRKIIGRLFIEVFEEQAALLPAARWLAQGTIYPDVIESAAVKSGKAHVIKSHHNVGGLPERMHLRLLEPLRELFKDEVRRLGVELGLPAEMVYRHPFPGPGLGVRVLGEVKPVYVQTLR